MNYNQLNDLDHAQLKEELARCCGSSQWIEKMIAIFPVSNQADIFSNALSIWYNECGPDDWLESFTHHPKIGEVSDLEKKFPQTAGLSAQEQRSVDPNDKDNLEALAEANKRYENHFGFTFIVSAAGKSPEEMLSMLNSRMGNERNDEIRCARTEQAKITVKRLKNLLELSESTSPKGSHLTTHVLDTASGLPASGMLVRLFRIKKGEGCLMAQGSTDADGRIGDLLPSGFLLKNGDYFIRFDTRDYFNRNNITGFYPEINIHFTVFDQSHYHVPLLVSPFGYSTYRGS